MKTIEQYKKDLAHLEQYFGFNPAEVEQGSHEWHVLRLGVISASMVWTLLKKNKSGKPSSSRQTYMKDLISQICTGEYTNIKAAPLAWGKEHESGARSAYEMITGEKVNEISFIYANAQRRCGISVDGLIEGKDKGLELKCPYSTTTHLDFILEGAVKFEYKMQCQFSMWVTGAKEWCFASYDPRMIRKILHTFTIQRDEDVMDQLNIEVPKFIKELDEILREIGISFGEHWDKEKMKWQQ